MSKKNINQKSMGSAFSRDTKVETSKIIKEKENKENKKENQEIKKYRQEIKK